MTKMMMKAISTRAFCMAVGALTLMSPIAASAAERVYQLRSLEDPSVSLDDAKAFCAAESRTFTANVVLPARIWVHRTRAADGQVTNDSADAIGTAFACAQLTNFLFPPGLQQNFSLKLNLPSGSYEAVGQCTFISNNVPKAGLVLAGCNLHVTKAPAGIVGGSATSSSVFNPFRLAGFNTGSYWTLLLYTDEAGPEDGVDHSSHDHDMHIVQ
jgi:hypothetical protein